MAGKLQILFYYLKFKFPLARQSREKIEKRQIKKIEKHIRHVTEEIPFYKSYKGTPFSEFPMMDKKLFMDHFQILNSKGISEEAAVSFAVQGERDRQFNEKLSGITVGLSSGTSGRRGAFLISDKENCIWAGYVLSHFLTCSIFGKCKIAFFMRANSNLYESVGNGRIRFRFFDIYQDMSLHIKSLNELNPDVLVGQPSVLLALSKAKQEGILSIVPKKIISVAEVLEERDAKRIREAFETPVLHQAYQCTEGCLALTCEFGNLHINEDIVYIEKEYIDETGFIPVITDFTRRTQPMIRYRLNDILREDKTPCPCGSHFTRIRKIEGREDDVFVFAGIGNGGEVKVFPDFIRRCALFTGEIDDYRIVQNKDGTISVYMDASEEQKRRLESEFMKLGEERKFILPPIEFHSYVIDKKRKMKRVERL